MRSCYFPIKLKFPSFDYRREKTLGFFVVINEQGPAWDNMRVMRGQDGWEEHAAFMDALADEHFIVLGGPLGNYSKHRAMLIVNAVSEKDLRGNDPIPNFLATVYHSTYSRSAGFTTKLVEVPSALANFSIFLSRSSSMRIVLVVLLGVIAA